MPRLERPRGIGFALFAQVLPHYLNVGTPPQVPVRRRQSSLLTPRPAIGRRPGALYRTCYGSAASICSRIQASACGKSLKMGGGGTKRALQGPNPASRNHPSDLPVSSCETRTRTAARRSPENTRHPSLLPAFERTRIEVILLPGIRGSAPLRRLLAAARLLSRAAIRSFESPRIPLIRNVGGDTWFSPAAPRRRAAGSTRLNAVARRWGAARRREAFPRVGRGTPRARAAVRSRSRRCAAWPPSPRDWG